MKKKLLVLLLTLAMVFGVFSTVTLFSVSAGTPPVRSYRLNGSFEAPAEDPNAEVKTYPNLSNFGAAKVSVEVDSDDETNHVVKVIPVGKYSSFTWNINDYVDEHGAGVYRISFYAKNVSNALMKFAAELCCPTLWNQPDTKTSSVAMYIVNNQWSQYVVNFTVSEAVALKVKGTDALVLRLDGGSTGCVYANLTAENADLAYYVDDFSISHITPSASTSYTVMYPARSITGLASAFFSADKTKFHVKVTNTSNVDLYVSPGMMCGKVAGSWAYYNLEDPANPGLNVHAINKKLIAKGESATWDYNIPETVTLSGGRGTLSPRTAECLIAISPDSSMSGNPAVGTTLGISELSDPNGFIGSYILAVGGKLHEVPTVTSENTAQGTVAVSKSLTDLNIGDEVKVTATPKTDCVFDGWYVDGVKVSKNLVETITIESGFDLVAKFKLHTHAFTALKHDANEHWYECECGEESGREEHKGGTATCTAEKICTVCNTPYGGMHNFTELKSDATSHWYKCADCNETTKPELHVDADRDSKCDVCGVACVKVFDLNGDAEDGLVGWTKMGGEEAKVESVEGGVFGKCIKITPDGPYASPLWNMTEYVKYYGAGVYRFSFYAKSVNPGKMAFNAWAMSNTGYAAGCRIQGGSVTINGTDWKKYVVDINITADIFAKVQAVDDFSLRLDGSGTVFKDLTSGVSAPDYAYFMDQVTIAFFDSSAAEKVITQLADTSTYGDKGKAFTNADFTKFNVTFTNISSVALSVSPTLMGRKLYNANSGRWVYFNFSEPTKPGLNNPLVNTRVIQPGASETWSYNLDATVTIPDLFLDEQCTQPAVLPLNTLKSCVDIRLADGTPAPAGTAIKATGLDPACIGELVSDKYFIVSATIKDPSTVVADDPAHGSVSANKDLSKLCPGDKVTLKAVATDGCVFEGWYDNGVKISDKAEYVVTVDTRFNIVAKFSTNHSHDLSIMDFDKNNHWTKCTGEGCVKTGTPAAHVDANHDGTCDVCGYIIGSDLDDGGRVTGDTSMIFAIVALVVVSGAVVVITRKRKVTE